MSAIIFSSMEELRNAFLSDVPRRISSLDENIQRLSAENAPPREILLSLFRQVHTLKGSAAALGFEAPSRIAHEIENLLESVPAERSLNSEEITDLRKIIEALALSFREDSAVPADSGISDILANQGKQQPQSFDSANYLPADLQGKLNPHEMKQLRQAASAPSAQISIIAAEFDAADFALKFARLRKFLSERGEVIATISDKSPDILKIGLRMVFVGDKNEAGFTTQLVNLGGKVMETISLERAPAKLKLAAVWAVPLLAAAKSAETLGKKVEFETSGGEIEIAAEKAEAVESAMLHILRNSVAHGIEKTDERSNRGKSESGVIKIDARAGKNDLILIISDDGQGIDPQKILKKAVEQGLIGKENKLSAEDSLNLIFAPRFSTAETLNEISGRGIGLDAVKTALEAAGGSIKVTSSVGRETVFEIIIPLF